MTDKSISEDTPLKTVEEQSIGEVELCILAAPDLRTRADLLPALSEVVRPWLAVASGLACGRGNIRLVSSILLEVEEVLRALVHGWQSSCIPPFTRLPLEGGFHVTVSDLIEGANVLRREDAEGRSVDLLLAVAAAASVKADEPEEEPARTYHQAAPAIVAEEEPDDEDDERTDFTCALLEPPDLEKALEWLQTDYYDLVAVCFCGFRSDDEKVRSDFHHLALDLRVLRCAALAAIKLGPEKVTLRAEGRTLDYDDRTRTLSRLVAATGLEEDPQADTPEAFGFRMLAEMLVRRLAEQDEEPEEDMR